MNIASPSTGPSLRPPLRAELLADNRAFVELASELLLAFRNTDDSACAICGAKQGVQHPKGKLTATHPEGNVCRQLVEWRASAQYKKV